MFRFVFLGCWMLGIGLASAGAAEPMEIKTGFDLIPINSAAGFAVHNLKELQIQGDQFVKNTDMEKEFGLRPSQAIPMIFGFLGLNKGRDDSIPAGIFIANLFEARVLDPSNMRDLERLIVIAVGFKDRDEIASNFGLSKGELKPEQITVINPKTSLGQLKLIYVKGNHLYLGNNERAILSVVKGKRLSEALSKSQKERLSRTDLLLHVGTSPWGPGWASFVQKAKEHAESLKDKETDPDTGLSTEMVQLLVESLPALQNLVFGAGIDEQGFELQGLVNLHPEGHPSAQKLLKLLRSGLEPSSLDALPNHKFIAAQAVRSDGSQNRALVRGMLEGAFLPFFNQKKLVTVADRPQFVGLFDEVWQRLKGSQLAVYRNDNPATEGLFSILAVLDTEDPQEFLAEMRQLSHFAKPGEMKLDGENRNAQDVAAVQKLVKELGDPNFRVRKSATLKLSLIGPPALPYLREAVHSKNREVVVRSRRLIKQLENIVKARKTDVMSQSLLSKLSARWGDFPKAETRNGVPIDIVKMELDDKSKGSESHLQEAFGPDWSKIRLAVHGKKIVVLLGSNTELIDETLANLDKKQPGLSQQPSLREFDRRAPADRRTEFHLILRRFVPLVKQGTQTPDTTTNEMTSLSLAIGKKTIELHLWVPNKEFRTFRAF